MHGLNIPFCSCLLIFSFPVHITVTKEKYHCGAHLYVEVKEKRI